MAHFYGTLQGARGETSRLGGKASGIQARVASWAGAVNVQLYDHQGEDWATVDLVPHQGKGSYRKLYEGPVSGMPESSAKEHGQ